MPLPIRLATSASLEETTATPETPDPPPINQAASGPALSLSPNPLTAENHTAGIINYASTPLSPDLGLHAATGNNHQFWLKDAKVAEELFTVSFLPWQIG